MIYVLAYMAIIACILYFVFSDRENFSTFVKMKNAEFKGINMLGLNSNDAHFATESEEQCLQICGRNPECRGYAWYMPGQRCYIYQSGDFVPGMPGYCSGKKM